MTSYPILNFEVFCKIAPVFGKTYYGHVIESFFFSILSITLFRRKNIGRSLKIALSPSKNFFSPITSGLHFVFRFPED
jgi:hypothetical protein